jgi:hypothetical protein
LIYILKGKFTLEQVTEAQRGLEVEFYSFFNFCARCGATPRPLCTLERDTVPNVQRLGGPQGQSGRVWKIFPPPEFDLRTIQSVASRYTNYAIQIHLFRFHSIPCMALQPLPDLGLPHKTSQFIPIFSSSPPSSYPQSQVVVYFLNPSEASLRFSQQRSFYRVGSSSPRPTPNLEDQGVPFFLGRHL